MVVPRTVADSLRLCRFGDGDLVRRIAPEPFNDVFAKAKKAATTFITQRVVPLSQLNFVDDECADVLDEDDVQEALKVGATCHSTACCTSRSPCCACIDACAMRFSSENRCLSARSLSTPTRQAATCVWRTDSSCPSSGTSRSCRRWCRLLMRSTPSTPCAAAMTRTVERKSTYGPCSSTQSARRATHRTWCRASHRCPLVSPQLTLPLFSYVTFMPFLELMGRIALVGFSKPFLQQSHPEAPQKITALFHWIRSSGNLRRIEQAEWQRGLTRRGRRMTPQQKRGLKYVCLRAMLCCGLALCCLCQPIAHGVCVIALAQGHLPAGIG